MPHVVLITLILCISVGLRGQIPIDLADVATFSMASEGDLYATPGANQVYIGLQDGTLRLISDLDSASWSLIGNTGTNPSINFLGTIDNQDLVLRSSNVEKLRLTNDRGQVRINQAPIFNNHPLVIRANGNDVLAFQDASGVPRWHWNLLSDGLNFVESNVLDYRLFLQNGGYVGINTNNPTEQLDVNGTARIRDLPDTAQSNFIVTADANGKLKRKTIRLLDAYDNTGGQTFTTTLTRLNLDVERTNIGFASLSNDQVTIPEDGVYRITYSATYALTAIASSQFRTGARTELRINNTREPGSDVYSYHRINNTSSTTHNQVRTTTSTRSIIKSLSSGDLISIHGVRFEGTGTLITVAEGTGLSIEKLN